MIAMMFSALLASMAGTLFGQYMLFIDPDSVFMLSVPIMLTTVMGGTGSMWGPLVGATVLIPIQEVARVYFSGSGRAVDQLLYGIIIVSMVVAQPEGIMGWVKTIIESRKSSQSKQPVVLR
jgi:branched-chain amino acid transport system permease protein